MRRRLAIAMLCASSSMVSCVPYGLRQLNSGVVPEHDEARILTHAIFIDNDGHPLLPSTTSRARTSPGKIIRVSGSMVSITPDSAYESYVGRIMAGIRADSARRGRKPRLLLRIHGGLNSLNESLDATVAMTDAIMADTASDFYPIFVNWESGLVSSYGEHLFFLRRGSSRPLSSGESLFAPFYLGADLGSGIVRAPLTIAKQFTMTFRSHLGNTQAALLCPHQDDLPRNARVPSVDTTSLASDDGNKNVLGSERAVCRVDGGPRRSNAIAGFQPSGPDDQSIALSRFAYQRGKGEMVLDNGMSALFSWVPTRYFLMPGSSRFGSSFAESVRSSGGWRRPLTIAGWLPPKVLGLVIIDGLGPAAWSTMHRRTRTMIRSTAEFTSARRQVSSYVPESGALPILLDSLEQLIRSDSAYRLTLVGHSMGAIVATEIIRARDSLPIDNIVFMASAASVREFSGSVLPYLYKHPRTQFYNLTLHPWSDQREWAKGPVLPYGSLLEWIDSYFASPETVDDMMMGKYDNAVLTASVLGPQIRSQIHIKSFGYHSHKGCTSEDLPFKHGQFNEAGVPFWRKTFWLPAQAGCANELSLP